MLLFLWFGMTDRHWNRIRAGGIAAFKSPAEMDELYSINQTKFVSPYLLDLAIRIDFSLLCGHEWTENLMFALFRVDFNIWVRLQRVPEISLWSPMIFWVSKNSYIVFRTNTYGGMSSAVILWFATESPSSACWILTNWMLSIWFSSKSATDVVAEMPCWAVRRAWKHRNHHVWLDIF